MKLISDVTAPALGHGCTTSKLARPHNIYTMPQPSVSPFPFVVYKSMEEPDSNDVSYHEQRSAMQALYYIALLQLARPHNISCFTIALLQLMQAPKAFPKELQVDGWTTQLSNWIILRYTYTLPRILTNVIGIYFYMYIQYPNTFSFEFQMFFLIRIELVGSDSGSEGTVSHCRLCLKKYQMLGL